jgi:hypothetical protein
VRHKAGDLAGVMTRFFPKVLVVSTEGSTDRPASLLGQTDAVQCPVAICGYSFAWTIVLWCGGGKDDG